MNIKDISGSALVFNTWIWLWRFFKSFFSLLWLKKLEQFWTVVKGYSGRKFIYFVQFWIWVSSVLQFKLKKMRVDLLCMWHLVNLSQNYLWGIKLVNKNVYFQQCSSRGFTRKCLKQNILRQKPFIFQYKVFKLILSIFADWQFRQKKSFVCLSSIQWETTLSCFSMNSVLKVFHPSFLKLCVFQFCFQEQFLPQVAISVSYEYSS